MMFLVLNIEFERQKFNNNNNNKMKKKPRQTFMMNNVMVMRTDWLFLRVSPDECQVKHGI